MTQRARLLTLDDSGDAAPPIADGETVVVVGNFDGVHRGHQAVLTEAVEQAAQRGLSPVVLTFDPHPNAVVADGPPPVLTPLARKVELLGRLGVARVYARRFEPSFAAWTPEQFARDLLRATLHARIVVVGENFRFGARRSGDLTTLRQLGATLGFEARVHEVARDATGAFSSTRAREAIAAGDLPEAFAVLGRWHAISGTVGMGAQRGRTIGFPTVNLEGIPELLPANGVYAVAVDRLEGDRARALAHGVMNVGLRPTVADAAPRRTAEAHLFDFDGDLYGASLRVHLVARLRDEQKFPSFDALRVQIAEDARQARERLVSVRPAASADGAYG